MAGSRYERDDVDGPACARVVVSRQWHILSSCAAAAGDLWPPGVQLQMQHTHTLTQAPVGAHSAPHVLRHVPVRPWRHPDARGVATCAHKASLRLVLRAADASSFSQTCSKSVDCSLQGDHMEH